MFCPAGGRVCFKIMHVHCWCCENETSSKQKAGSQLASVVAVHGSTVLPGTGHLSPEHLQMIWESSCLLMCGLSLVSECCLLQPWNPHAAKICISAGVAT